MERDGAEGTALGEGHGKVGTSGLREGVVHSLHERSGGPQGVVASAGVASLVAAARLGHQVEHAEGVRPQVSTL